MSDMITKANSMTLVDRLALRIKESELGAFITEDELIELGSEAIKKAFFEPQRTQGRYPSDVVVRDPMIVEMARNTFQTLMSQRVAVLVESLANTPEFQQAIQEVAIASIPDLVLNYGRRLAMETASATARGTVSAVLDRVRTGNLDANLWVDTSPAEMEAEARAGTEGRDLPPVR